MIQRMYHDTEDVSRYRGCVMIQRMCHDTEDVS